MSETEVMQRVIDAAVGIGVALRNLDGDLRAGGAVRKARNQRRNDRRRLAAKIRHANSPPKKERLQSWPGNRWITNRSPTRQMSRASASVLLPLPRNMIGVTPEGERKHALKDTPWHGEWRFGYGRTPRIRFIAAQPVCVIPKHVWRREQRKAA